MNESEFLGINLKKKYKAKKSTEEILAEQRAGGKAEAGKLGFNPYAPRANYLPFIILGIAVFVFFFVLKPKKVVK